MRGRMACLLLALLPMAFHIPIEPPDPVISDLKVSPQSGPAGTVYKISLRIQSRGQIVQLLHQKREGREVIDVVLRDDGRNGDGMRGDKVYAGKALVPHLPMTQTQRFEVYVQDSAGRKSNLLEYHFTISDGDGV